MTGNEKYVSTAALAAHFGVSAATIITMVRSGDIPAGTYTRMGRVFRFDLNSVESALLARTQVSSEGKQMELDFNQISENETEQYETENDNG